MHIYIDPLSLIPSLEGSGFCLIPFLIITQVISPCYLGLIHRQFSIISAVQL